MGAIIASAVTRGGAAQTWLLAIRPPPPTLAGPSSAGQPAHPRRAEQAHRPGPLVRRHRGRVHRGCFDCRRPGRPLPGLHHRGLRGGPGLPRLPRHQPVAGLRHQLARLSQLYRNLPPASRPDQRSPACRGPLHRRVLPPGGPQLAALVLHPEHRPAHRGQHRPPQPYGGRHRGWRRSRPSPATSAATTSPSSLSTTPTPSPWTTRSRPI